ncbi:MAG: hypothetical protein KJ044_16455, partial [Planctomycetes bacterium]|nr:hypothetical protein [Planctomycetota bacterium]
IPLHTLLVRTLDTTVFSAARDGLVLSDAPNLRFDQYLLADPARAEDPRFAHLRKTWAQPAREATQLRLLPPDTMLQVSYRQPLDVMYHEVLTERDRQSLVGDFFVAMQSPALRSALAGPVEEVLFATAPRSYAPGVTAPVPPVELPLPAFCIGFRVPGAGAEIPRLLLEEYLQAQRGRGQEPGEQPRTGAAVVVELAIEGRRAWGLHDPRDDPGNQILIRLNRSIRSALVGDWLLLTNSESLVARAIRNSTGSDRGLAADARNPFAQLDSVSSATIYVNLDVTADYLAGTAELFKLLRDTRYNPLLPEGLAPSDLRREIARSFGLDPASPAALDDPRVDAEYQRRKEVWAQTCQIEGDQYVARLQANFRAMRFFRDLALTTSFAADHLHVRGLLRVG